MFFFIFIYTDERRVFVHCLFHDHRHSFFKDLFKMTAWVKDFKIIPEFRILKRTFHRKSASKC